jgi:hypothetical protein
MNSAARDVRQTVLVPSRRHDDPAAVGQGVADVGGAANILITGCRAHPDYEGQTLAEIAHARGITPVEVYIQIVKDGGASVVCRSRRGNLPARARPLCARAALAHARGGRAQNDLAPGLAPGPR